MSDIWYDIDDMVVCLNKIERYITTYSDTGSTVPSNGEAIINATPINMVNANSSLEQPMIILDEWLSIWLTTMWNCSHVVLILMPLSVISSLFSVFTFMEINNLVVIQTCQNLFFCKIGQFLRLPVHSSIIVCHFFAKLVVNFGLAMLASLGMVDKVHKLFQKISVVIWFYIEYQ